MAANMVATRDRLLRSLEKEKESTRPESLSNVNIDNLKLRSNTDLTNNFIQNNLYIQMLKNKMNITLNIKYEISIKKYETVLYVVFIQKRSGLGTVSKISRLPLY